MLVSNMGPELALAVRMHKLTPAEAGQLNNGIPYMLDRILHKVVHLPWPYIAPCSTPPLALALSLTPRSALSFFSSLYHADDSPPSQAEDSVHRRGRQSVASCVSVLEARPANGRR